MIAVATLPHRDFKFRLFFKIGPIEILQAQNNTGMTGMHECKDSSHPPPSLLRFLSSARVQLSDFLVINSSQNLSNPCSKSNLS